jgi:glycosyltransferase involved in cell wall biosynthesis
MSPVNIPVSILIPIRNEAGNLPRCLASVAWAEEVIVVDSQSTDGSVALAEATGARVVQFQFNGTWPKKKNWALANVPFRHEWVLILDADEVMPPGSAEEIGALVAADTQATPGAASPAGYWINRRFMFMGGWLKHAYYPNWNLRLFRHRLGRYEQLVQGATQSGDNEVHEHIVVAGPTDRLHCEMDHYAFPSIDVFVEKHNRYSNWEARLELEEGLQTGGPALQSSAVDLRRRLKRWSRRLPFRPTLRFLYVYVLQRGFLDGARGYYFARLHAFYEFMSVAKAAELRLPPSSVPQVPAVVVPTLRRIESDVGGVPALHRLGEGGPSPRRVGGG